MDWIKTNALLVLVAIVLMAGVSVTSYQKGKEDERASQLQTKLDVSNQKQEKQNERQDKADQASQTGEDALAKATADADAARDDADGVRRQLATANARAAREAASATGERKAAAERERVYTELLDESTRLVQVYARAAEEARTRGETCEGAWPE